MTYITRLIMNKERGQTRRLVGDAEALHAAVMKSFSQPAIDEMDEKTGRILWNLEFNRDPELYIFSPVPPDLSHLVEQVGRPNDEFCVVSKSYDTVLAGIEAGAKFRFRVKVNPTFTQNGKKVAHVTDVQALKWLSKKAASCGFSIEDADVKDHGFLRFKKNSGRVTLKWVTAEGVLSITNAEAFVSSVKNGIGRGKAYGLGMLTVAKIG